MRKLSQTLLLAMLPFIVSAQKSSWGIDLYLKTNLMYANSMSANNSDHYHFRSPLAGGATIWLGVPISDKVLFQTGIGYAPTKYALKFLLDSNSLVYKYKVSMNVGTLKLPVRFQFLVNPRFSLVAGLTFNYNRNWPCHVDKSYRYTGPEYQYLAFSYDTYKTSYLDEDYITFSGDLAVKYRVRSWLEFFAMGSYDIGKYPSISAFNQIGADYHLSVYQGAISPKLLTLSMGISWRLRTYDGGRKSKAKKTKEYIPGEKGVNVDILNGVLPQ